MNKDINNIKKTRLYLLEAIKDLPVEQLNQVPPGFNNNIVWNLGHMIAAQQGVCYLRAGVQTFVDEKYFHSYKPGTKPEHPVDEKEVELIKGLLLSSLEQFETDYQNNLFPGYSTWTTRYDVGLTSVDDAIHFLAFHAGLHSGVIMALKRLVQ